MVFSHIRAALSAPVTFAKHSSTTDTIAAYVRRPPSMIVPAKGAMYLAGTSNGSCTSCKARYRKSGFVGGVPWITRIASAVNKCVE